MNNKFSTKYFIKVLIGMSLAFIIMLGFNFASATSNDLNNSEILVKVLAIGQGDAILIKSGNHFTMIDTGRHEIDNRERIIKLLRANDVETIDNLIITHPHSDHLGGATPIMKTFNVGHVYDNGQEYSSHTYKTYIKTMKKYKIPRTTLKAGEILQLGNGAEFRTFAPGKKYILNGEHKIDANNNSVVGKLVFGKFSMIFTGDAEKEEEAKLVSTYGDELRASILKAGHHGSRTSSSKAFLKYVKPRTVVVSVGNDKRYNKYGHPHDAALNRMKWSIKSNYKVDDPEKSIFRTDLYGTITIIGNNNGTYKIKAENNVKKVDSLPNIIQSIKNELYFDFGSIETFQNLLTYIKTEINNSTPVKLYIEFMEKAVNTVA